MATGSINWDAVGAVATAGATTVALLLGASDILRRKSESKARRRIAMATLYSPVVGLVAILEKVAEGATTCVKVSSGEEARQISDDVLRLQTGCEILEGLLLAIDRSRVSDIPDDLGTSIALSVGDTRLIVDLVKSATERYILHQEQNDFSQMVEGAMTMKDIPKIAVSTCQNLAPFINACKKELGEKSLSDLQSND